MNSNKILQLTRELEKIADSLETMENRYLRSVRNVTDYSASMFSELLPAFQHQAEIRRRAYERIKLIYLKKLDEITSIV